MTETSFHPPLKARAHAEMDAIVTAFCDHTGTTPGTISRMLCGDKDFVQRLLAGGNYTVGQFDKVAAGLSRLWPDDLAWPGGVPRPAPASLPPEVEGPARKLMVAAAERRARRDLNEKHRQEREELKNGRAA